MRTIRETGRLFQVYIIHEFKVFRTPVGLLGLMIAAILILCAIVIFMAYHGTWTELIQSFAVELFGTAVIFATVELLWETFMRAYITEQPESDPHLDEITRLHEEIGELKALLYQALANNPTLQQPDDPPAA